MEDEVFPAVFFDSHSTDSKVHMCNQFLTVACPVRANAEELFACLQAAMGYVGVTDWAS